MSRELMRAEWRSLATPENLRAWDELERRGFSICYHFGYQNAAEILRDMEWFRQMGLLFWWLKRRFGMDYGID